MKKFYATTLIFVVISAVNAQVINFTDAIFWAIGNSSPEFSNSAAIDISGLQTGTYFLRIISDKGSTNTKFIKE